MPSLPAAAPRPRRVAGGLVLLLAVLGAVFTARAETRDVATFLTDGMLDRQQRRVLEEPGEWTDAKQRMLIRVLATLDVPAPLMIPWKDAASDLAARGAEVADALVRVRGRATFVAELPLTDEQRLLAGGKPVDLVRIVSADGVAVDVATRRGPRSWPRWQVIDEPAEVVGLPLATAGGPRPAPADAAATAWPGQPAALLLAADGVAWHPDTPLGRLGMDYSLFDTVEDGGRIKAGDNPALFALLAAAGRPEAAAVRGLELTTDRILPLIDPRQKWFAGHRGDAVTVTGIARRATRVAIDEPVRQRQVGADHYWEVFVFADTPLLKVNDRVQDDYPFVCCVRSLPAGFPGGDRISERVSVTGFALKRYGYPLPDLDISSSQGDRETRGQRMETALLVGGTPVWERPAPVVDGRGLSTIFAMLAAAVGLLLAFGAWRMQRDAGRAAARKRAQLPDRLELPDDRR
jgi:hypothetical protein